MQYIICMQAGKVHTTLLMHFFHILKDKLGNNNDIKRNYTLDETQMVRAYSPFDMLLFPLQHKVAFAKLTILESI